MSDIVYETPEHVAALFIPKWEMSFMASGAVVITYDLPPGVSLPRDDNCHACLMSATQGAYSLMCVYSDGTPVVLLNMFDGAINALRSVDAIKIIARDHDGRIIRCIVEEGVDGLDSALHGDG